MHSILNPRLDLALRGLAAAALTLSGVSMWLLLGLVRAWQGMPQDAREIGVPALPLARLLLPLTLEITLALLTGLLALGLLAFRAWLTALPDRDDAAMRRAFGMAVQVFRWVCLLGVLGAIGMQLWRMGQPQPAMQLLPAGMYTFLTVTLVVTLTGPILGLLWLSLGALARWAGRVGTWGTRPGPAGALHRALRDATSPMKYAAALLLGLGVWMLPATAFRVTTSESFITAFDGVMMRQLQPLVGVVVGLLLLTGLTLVLWRALSRGVCHHLDAQRSGVADLVRRTPVAAVDRDLRETPAAVLRRAIRPPY